LTLAGQLLVRGRMVLAFAVTLVLLGCATPPRPAEVQTVSWQGRLAIVVDSEPRESHRANFDLMGTAKAGELSLLSPLGTTVAQARWTQDAVLLTQGNRSVRYDNLEDLSAELLGAALPIDALFDWLQGRGTRLVGAPICADSLRVGWLRNGKIRNHGPDSPSCLSRAPLGSYRHANP
jgi:outer membrane lipoprotein LolB